MSKSSECMFAYLETEEGLYQIGIGGEWKVEGRMVFREG